MIEIIFGAWFVLGWAYILWGTFHPSDRPTQVRRPWGD